MNVGEIVNSSSSLSPEEGSSEVSDASSLVLLMLCSFTTISNGSCKLLFRSMSSLLDRAYWDWALGWPRSYELKGNEDEDIAV